MRLKPFKKVNWNYLLLAFLLPFVGMCILMIIRSFEPFGSLSMLYSDMYHQYYPFFVDFRRALLQGDSLLYSWSTGMGMDYLGLISYYLASPLNLLSVLVPEALLLEYFSLLMPIKLGFAGLFFALFLKKLFNNNDFSIVVFGSFYALCAWALGYQWNIMWLDTFALLPLVALGAVSVLRDRKFVLYIFSLFLSVFSNYYIGFFTCIFVVLVFICYEISRWGGFKKFFIDIGLMGFYSVIAIGMTAILELPAYAALQNTQSSVNTFPDTFRLNMTDDHTWKGLIDVMGQVAGNMNGAIVPTFKEGLPNLYCGIAANVFAVLFLTCKQVRLRDKICCVLLLIFFNISFIIRQLDYIWHGFHFTNMIPYRFSFLYSFVVLYMAYRAYSLRYRFRLWQVLVAIVAALGIAFCANDLSDPVYWCYNGVFLLLYGAALVYPFTQRRPDMKDSLEKKQEYMEDRRFKSRVSAKILLGIMAVELALNLVNFGVAFTGTNVQDYPRGTIYSQTIINEMHRRETGTLFYRADTTHSQTLNDGALNGYNGISAFTSSANVRVTRFMKALGYGAKDTYNRYCYEESSPVSNLFLNLKYMIERSGQVEENLYFKDVASYGNVHLLENQAYLPLGFLAENTLAGTSFYGSSNTFAFQNRLFRDATGISADVWQMLGGDDLVITGTNVSVNARPLSGYCSYTVSAGTDGKVTFRYQPQQAGFMCVGLVLSKRNNYSFWKNGVHLYSENYSIPQSLSVCQVAPGDVIEVQFSCTAGDSGTIQLYAGLLNDTVFRQGYKVLSASTLQLTSFSRTTVEGTIDCNRDGLLYTSIPQDGNWTATVDGESVPIVLVGEAMIGLNLSEGSHQIQFKYHNPAYCLGWKISLACVVVFFGLYLAIYRPGRRKGKYENPCK